LQQAEADFDVLPFDGDCARAFGAVAGGTARIRAGHKPAVSSDRSPILIASREDATRLFAAEKRSATIYYAMGYW
jgi:hypothetical protein